MGYVNSSPWQDAANFGGAVGDRLAEALINLPLKKSQMSLELLQNASQIKNRQAQQQIALQRAQAQQIHYGDEKQHWQNEEKNVGDALTQKKHDSQEKDYLAAQKSGLDSRRQAETQRHNMVMEGEGKERIKAAHDRVLALAATDKAPHPEFGGLTLGQVLQKANTGVLPPEIDAAFNKYLMMHLNQPANQPTNGLGNALQPQQQPQGGLPGGVKVTRIQ